MKKLKEAGLGKRPIIWIGHSMGGRGKGSLYNMHLIQPDEKTIINCEKLAQSSYLILNGIARTFAQDLHNLDKLNSK